MKKVRNGFMKNLRYLCLIGVIALGLMTIVGTGGGGGGGGGETGTLSVSLTDATTEEYNAVYVTIEEVQVHVAENDWEAVGSPNKTYNLLELVNGVTEQLGLTELEAGDYTQMRLIIGDTHDGGTNILGVSHPYANYIIDESDNSHELKIPSGFQTGIKIVHGFSINANETTELILDFDASKSVVKAGRSGKWLLKPTIKVINMDEASTVSGTVTDVNGDPLEGVSVSAQVYDSDAADAKQSVVIQASTITDEGGSYTIFLQPGTYNLVAYREGYNPECAKIVDASNSSYTHDFALSAASTGEITGTVSISDGNDEQYVTLSFRQGAQCEGSSEEEQIEVQSLNVANGGDYSVNLPEGAYNVIASTDERETQQYDVTIPTELDIEF